MRSIINYPIKYIQSHAELERACMFYRKTFKDKCDIDNPVYSLEAWKKRMINHSDLLIYSHHQDIIIGMAFARSYDEKAVIVGPLAVDHDFRGLGLAKKMMSLLEENAKKLAFKKLQLGSLDGAENFYKKLGYQAFLLVQAEDVSIDQLLSLKGEAQVKFAKIYEDKIHQVCLKTEEFDTLRLLYETTFRCHTMIMFEKQLI